MVFFRVLLGKEVKMKFFMNQQEISDKDKSRPPETSEEIAAERSSQNESADTSNTTDTT